MRRRLDARTAAADALAAFATLGAGAIGVIIGVRLAGVTWPAAIGLPLASVAVGALVVGTLSVITVRCTSFAVSDERIDREFRLGVRHRQLAPTRRIRSVEVTANPAQRLLGLADVHIATGDRTGRLSLHSLRRADAEALRHSVLRSSGLASTEASARSGELARFRWSWLRFAQLSFWTPVLGAGAVGISFRVAGWFNADTALWQWYRDLPGGEDGGALVVLGVLAGLLVGAVTATALVLENWWNCRLSRDDDGTLRLTRGLLNQRSTTLDGKRVRGAVLVEPLGARWQGAARVQALAVGAVGADDTGTSSTLSSTSSSDALLPEVPRPLAMRVMTAIVGPVVEQPLLPHPPAARRRRRVRAAAGALVSTAALLAAAAVVDRAAAWWAAVIGSAVLSAAYVWSAAAGYRSLGHLLTDRFLIFRSGAWSRRTSVLQRAGVVGWQLSRSPLQRRAGLVTVTALTSTRTPALTAPDAGNAQALRLVLDAAPYWRALLADPRPRARGREPAPEKQHSRYPPAE